MSRKGFMALWLLTTMAALLSIMATLAYSAAQGIMETASYRNGLTAEYAAESGAVWALSYIRKNGFPSAKMTETIPIGEEETCTVTFHQESVGGVIDLCGRKNSTGERRYLQLTVETDDTGVRVLTATNTLETF